MNSRYLFIVGLCVAACLIFFIVTMLMEKTQPDSEPDIALPKPTEQEIKGFRLPGFSRGRKEWEVVGEKAHRKEGSEVVYVVAPVITVWSSSKGPNKEGIAPPPDRISTIVAPNAELNSKSEDAHLTGGVTIVVSDAAGREEGRVKSQELRWSSKDQTATTDGPAEIFRADMKITGIGMRADIRRAVFEILHDVKIELVPPAEDKTSAPAAAKTP